MLNMASSSLMCSNFQSDFACALKKSIIEYYILYTHSIIYSSVVYFQKWVEKVESIYLYLLLFICLIEQCYLPL